MTDLPLGVEAYPEEAVGRSDAELITAVRSGDTEAYGELFDRHVGSARSMARQLTRDPNEADDLVAEAFAKVLVVLQGGGGPDVAFRAYLLTALRRVAYDRTRSGSRVQVTDDLTPFDTGVDFVDPAIEGLEKSIVARAYASLPERWQTVLWHTEVEGLQPGEVAPLLGLTANGVAALAYRAREGLRQAYLQQHVMGELDDACRPYADKLGAYARGGLAKRETAHVEQHLEGCERCRALVLELSDVNHGMRVVVAPLLLGLAAAGYLKAAAAGGATVGAVGMGAGGAAAGAAGAAGTAATAAVAGATATAGAGMTAGVTGAAAAAGSASSGAVAAGAASGGGGASTSVGYVTSTASSTAGAASTTAAGATAALTVVPSAAAAGGLFAGGGLLVGAAAAVVGLAAAGVVVAVVASTNDQGPVTALPPTTSTSVPVLPNGGGSVGGTSASTAPVVPVPAPTSAAPTQSPTSTPTSLPALAAAPTYTVPSPTPTTALTTAPATTPTTTPTPTPEPTTTTPTPTPTPTPTFSAVPTPSPTSTSEPSPTDSATPTPTPTPTPTESTTPTPTGTPTPTPTPSPTESPSPTPSPTPTGPLSVTVPDGFGPLVQGETGTVGFTLTNTGSSATPTLTATITLPDGVALVSTTKGIDTGSSGWSCQPTDAGAICTYPALPPGASTTLALQVLVAPEAAPGTGPVTITIEGKQVDPVVVPDNRTVVSASNGTTSSSG